MDDRIHIVIDTREQRPWSFDESNVITELGTLKTADYQLKDDFRFGIERKSLDDFVGTISSGWKRFQREIKRMDEGAWDAKVVIVEGNFRDCCYSERDGMIIPPVHNHHRISPKFIMKQVALLTLDRVSVLFAGDAHMASNLAYQIFKERHEELNRDIEF